MDNTTAKKVTISEKFSMVAKILKEQGHENLVEFILNEKAKVDKKNAHKSSKSKSKGLTEEQKARVNGFIALVKDRTLETGITLNEIQKSLDITQGQLSFITKNVLGLGKKVIKGRTHYYNAGGEMKPAWQEPEQETVTEE